MSYAHTKWVVNLVVLVIVATFVRPPIVEWSKVAGIYSWRETIKDFQTLFGGALAVLAAYVTIQQMQTSDQAQERRHQDIMDVTLRKDRDAVARVSLALTPTLSRLIVDIRQFEAHLDEREDVVAWHGMSRWGFMSAFREIRFFLYDCESVAVKAAMPDLPATIAIPIDRVMEPALDFLTNTALGDISTQPYRELEAILDVGSDGIAPSVFLPIHPHRLVAIRSRAEELAKALADAIPNR